MKSVFVLRRLLSKKCYVMIYWFLLYDYPVYIKILLRLNGGFYGSRDQTGFCYVEPFEAVMKKLLKLSIGKDYRNCKRIHWYYLIHEKGNRGNLAYVKGISCFALYTRNSVARFGYEHWKYIYIIYQLVIDKNNWLVSTTFTIKSLSILVHESFFIQGTLYYFPFQEYSLWKYTHTPQSKAVHVYLFI